MYIFVRLGKPVLLVTASATGVILFRLLLSLLLIAMIVSFLLIRIINGGEDGLLDIEGIDDRFDR